MRLTPRLIQSNAVHLAKLSDAPLTGREKEYLAGRLLQTVHLNFTEKDDNNLLATKLFGTPFIPAEENYPACPRCGGPMHNLFQLNFREAGLAIVSGCDLLVFYFCFKCNPLKHTEPGWGIRTYAGPEKMKARTDLVSPPIPDQFEVEGMIFPVVKSWSAGHLSYYRRRTQSLYGPRHPGKYCAQQFGPGTLPVIHGRTKAYTRMACAVQDRRLAGL